MLDEERCWQAVVERDSSRDGELFFGVLTTGVFCRPSCAARRPRRENVRFFTSAEDAERSGLRACKRCRPLDRDEDRRVEKIRALCAYIRESCDAGEPLTAAVLAARAGLKPARLRRLFQQVVGVTPRQFVEACRFEKLKDGLKEGEEVTRAIYDAGFNSSSRVYDQTAERLGMTPSQYRDGGRGLAISYALTSTPVGKLIVAGTDRGLCFVHFGESESELEKALRLEFSAATLEPAMTGTGPLETWLAAIERHLEGAEPHLELPLDVRATAFQLRVWRYLQSIPYGETRSYAEVAEAIGSPRASRAVGTACAANTVALAIPCHRVLRANGDLAGYRWGQGRKRALLDREREAQGISKPS